MRRALVLAALVAVLVPAAADAVIRGRPVPPGSAPWAAALKDRGARDWDAYCTGTLVAPRWVLTAAHCSVTRTPNDRLTRQPIPARFLSVVLGGRRLTSRRSPSFRVTAVRVNPGWRGGPSTAYFADHDFALWRLARRARVRPAALAGAAKLEQPGRRLRIMGYGEASLNERFPVVRPLRSARLGVVGDSACGRALARDHSAHARQTRFAGRYLVCVGSTTHRFDAGCFGDSGGPLLAGSTVVGVASGGDDDCAQRAPFMPTVYGSVRSVRGWLARVLR